MHVKEAIAEERLRCGLISLSSSYSEVSCANELMRWALLEAFNGRLIPVDGLRKRYTYILEKNGSYIKDTPEYWAAIRKGNSVSRRFYLVLQRLEAIRPLERYELRFEGHVIRGEYGLLRQYSSNIPMILVLHPYRSTYAESPGFIEMARYLHLIMNTSYAAAEVFNLPLFRGRTWTRKSLDVRLVRSWMSSMMKSMTVSPFPVPGTHCQHCVLKSCSKVFQ